MRKLTVIALLLAGLIVAGCGSAADNKADYESERAHRLDRGYPWCYQLKGDEWVHTAQCEIKMRSGEICLVTVIDEKAAGAPDCKSETE
jgi:hypothetical protein